MLLSFGCGSGSWDNATVTPTKAIISFSLISTSQLPFRLSGVQMSATLPSGLKVAASGSTITSGLEAGSAVSNSVTLFPVFGRYSAPNRVTMLVADGTSNQAGFGPGEMARLTCALIDGTTTISENDRLTMENSLTFNASGWNPTAAINPSSLNIFLKPRIAVTLTN
jgi:hypothetical protein